jgi:hypothetical protein
MIENFEESQRRKTARIQSTIAYVFGGLIMLLGLYLLTYEVLGLKLVEREPSAWDKFIGIVFVLYGAWRIYKGYKMSQER